MKKSLRFTDINFEKEVLQSKIPVLVDFWASWCPPCKMIEPVIEKLAQIYDGKIKIGKLNVDQNPKMRAKYQIKGVPTFIVFVSGKEIERKVAAHSEAQLREILDKIINRINSNG
jgi:thioredoxin 1